MSKTDKTAPFWVKMMRGDIASAEVHDHADGICDMPDRTARPGGTSVRGCRRVFVYTGTNVCCCAMCHGNWGVRPGKRRRIESRRMCRDWDTEF
jgi:hypothetical protein